MAAEGLENTIRVKVIKSKCGTDAFKDDYMQIFSFIAIFLDMQPSFLSQEWPVFHLKLVLVHFSYRF